MTRTFERGRNRNSELGLTMVELVVAIAISALIVAGTLVLLRQTVMVGTEHRHETMASLQVQYVGFWISEDAMQAQTIELGESNGFPLIITWTDGDGNSNEITYELVEMGGGSGMRQMERSHTLNGQPLGTSVVSEFLDPGSTTCYENPFEYVSSLMLEVTANCDGGEATSTYEIHPRAYVTWLSLEES